MLAYDIPDCLQACQPIVTFHCMLHLSCMMVCHWWCLILLPSLWQK
jgi:hypothetical protein